MKRGKRKTGAMIADRVRTAKAMTRGERKKRIVAQLKPLKGHAIYNKNIQQPVKFTGKGIDEVGQHGSYNNLSMHAAIDAPNQVRKAVKEREYRAKKNRKQQAMRLVKMVTMKGTYKGVPTKVNVGKTATGVHKIYSITIKRRKG